MTAVTRYESKAAEYRGKAAAALQAASATSLDQVRAKHARAAERWNELAEVEDLRARQSQIFRGTAPDKAGLYARADLREPVASDGPPLRMSLVDAEMDGGGVRESASGQSSRRVE